MKSEIIKKEIKTYSKNGINYIYVNGKKKRYKPWLSDSFSFLYDFIMRKSIFPKKLAASLDKHTDFLKKQFATVHNINILELATGSGNAAEIISNDNYYIGIDISEGLLRQAIKKFKNAGFKNAELYLSSADDLPFSDNNFDACLCNLSLNFFPNLNAVTEEIKRVLKKKGYFLCSVPVPERNRKKSRIHGILYSEQELKEIFEKHNFEFVSLNYNNGAILSFKAILIEK
jgi:ubiquinone/menaquinone biosynthesis C-methylase UbiE